MLNMLGSKTLSLGLHTKYWLNFILFLCSLLTLYDNFIYIFLRLIPVFNHRNFVCFDKKQENWTCYLLTIFKDHFSVLPLLVKYSGLEKFKLVSVWSCGRHESRRKRAIRLSYQQDTSRCARQSSSRFVCFSDSWFTDG